MKKAIIIAVIVVAVSVICTLLVLRGCPGGLVGSGNLETETYAFANFTEVEISSAFEFEIEQSSSYSINVTADDNVMEYVQVSKDGQTLKIGLRTGIRIGSATLNIGFGTFPFLESVTLKVSVTMPELTGLTASGASRGTISDFSSTEDLDITVSGASRVTGDLMAGNVDFGISGASTIELEGSANDMVADVSGASSFKLDDFTVNDADINFSGASSGTVNLNGRLDADLSGASRLWYIGEPTMGTIDTSGASSLSKK
ncbi:MAG: DUF2807 domain-containing protein [Dehalococcoidia bacterium]|nr:DUF2807 domain-containing protein [Dehalococcoidia bacterium]